MADTAIDTNVLLDVLLADPDFGQPSMQALDRAGRAGRLTIGPATLAELATAFARLGKPDGVDAFLRDAGIRVTPMREEDCILAGQAFAAHLRRRGPRPCPSCGSPAACKACGSPLAGRDRIATDFLIMAHARRAGRLLTRDAGLKMRGVRVERP